MAEATKKITESKFQVGDRVRVSDGLWCKGFVGEVVSVDHDAHGGKTPVLVVKADQQHGSLTLKFIDQQLEAE